MCNQFIGLLDILQGKHSLFEPEPLTSAQMLEAVDRAMEALKRDNHPWNQYPRWSDYWPSATIPGALTIGGV